MSMIPQEGDDKVCIPSTVDIRGGRPVLSRGQFAWFFVALFLAVVMIVCGLIFGETLNMKFMIVLGGAVLILAARFIIIREHYFAKRMGVIEEKDGYFSYNTFWSVYDVADMHPYILSLANGTRAIAVELRKGGIVGKGAAERYWHHDAIKQAYAQLARDNISCCHLDAMDTIGQDDRMPIFLEKLNQTKNEDLRRLLLRIGDYAWSLMTRSYADYDIYVFYSRQKAELFWEDLKVSLNIFASANYAEVRLLNKAAIRQVVIGLFNLTDFSVNDASDTVFEGMRGKRYLRVISTIKGGVVTKRNKTVEEREQERRESQDVKMAKRGKRREAYSTAEVDLFADSYVGDTDNRLTDISTHKRTEVNSRFIEFGVDDISANNSNDDDDDDDDDVTRNTVFTKK